MGKRDPARETLIDYRTVASASGLRFAGVPQPPRPFYRFATGPASVGSLRATIRVCSRRTFAAVGTRTGCFSRASTSIAVATTLCSTSAATATATFGATTKFDVVSRNNFVDRRARVTEEPLRVLTNDHRHLM
ncbi:hypothetical protein MTO96_041512 [Rhipicephalus appendiculatus]